MQAALDPALARETLALTLDGTLSIAEASRNVGRVALQGEHPDLAWNYAVEHLEPLLAQLTGSGVNRFLPSVAETSTDAARAGELEELTAQRLPPEARSEAEKVTDLIRLRAIVKARELPLIDDWVARQQPVPER